MSALKNIAIAGASGSLGSNIFKKLVDSGKFNVRVLRRLGSKSVFPEGTDVVDVDYSSVDALTAALKGQDALVSSVGTEQVDGQDLLLQAAVAAGVKRFLPSEFGSDLDVPSLRALPVFNGKVKIHDLSIEAAKTSPITYTFVYNAGFLDWGIQYKFLLDASEGKPVIWDGGDIEFSSTSLSSVADAVVGVLTHPEETKNRAVYIHDAIITQNKLLALAKTIAPEKTWAPIPASIKGAVAESDKKLAAGDYGMGTWIPYLAAAVFNAEGHSKYTKTDNELLGVKGKTDEDIIVYLKQQLQQA